MKKMIFMMLIALFPLIDISAEEYKLNFEDTVYINNLEIPLPDIEKAKKLNNDKADEFLIIGHAGSPYKEPENTIEGFEQALKDGANGLEMDLCISKDNVIFLWHDWDPTNLLTKARAAGLQKLKYKPYFKTTKKANELYFKEIRENYGYILNHSVFLKSKYQIPTFEDFAKWAADKNKIKFIYLDIKIPPELEFYTDFFVEEIFRISKENNILDKIVFFSPHKNIVKRARTYSKQYNLPIKIGLDREIPNSLIINTREKNFIYEILDIKKDFFVIGEANELDLKYAAIGRPNEITIINGWNSYEKIIAYNIKMKENINIDTSFIVWTIDNENEMIKLYKYGVNGIITNYPDKLSKLIRMELK